MAKGARNYPKTAVLKAISGSNGIVSVVAQRLKCDWSTARKYIEKWPDTQDIFAAERERVTDVAESNIVSRIRAGDEEASKWWLNRIGKKRGFVTKTEFSGEFDGVVTFDMVMHEPDEDDDETDED
jgi:hypothetical protein